MQASLSLSFYKNLFQAPFYFLSTHLFVHCLPQDPASSMVKAGCRGRRLSAVLRLVGFILAGRAPLLGVRAGRTVSAQLES